MAFFDILTVIFSVRKVEKSFQKLKITLMIVNNIETLIELISTDFISSPKCTLLQPKTDKNKYFFDINIEHAVLKYYMYSVKSNKIH